MTDAVDYQAVVADLRARRAALDQLITSVEALVLGQGDPGAIKLDAGAPSANGIPAAIHADTFYGLSMIDAAKKYLRMVHRAQHTGTIAEALGKGGLKRPDANILSSILVRAAKGREVTKVGKGMWGLAEWYPPKAAKEPEERPRGRRGPRMRFRNKDARAKFLAKKAAKKAEAAGPRATEENASPKVEGKPLDAVLEVLRAAGRPMHADEIVERARKLGVQASRLPIEGFLGRQVKAGVVKKIGPRVYEIAS